MILAAFFATALAKGRKYPDINMPELREGKKRAMVVCPSSPQPGKRYPVIGYAHGDTVSPNSYRPAMQMMADEGFCCIAYRSCEDDSDCDDGRADFIELLKMFKHLDAMTPSDDLPIDMTQPLSMAGHSTGGREALVIAALKNDPSRGVEFLKDKPQMKLLTPDLKAILPRIKAVCADHPDEMYSTTSAWSGKVDNPDPDRFRITDTPTLIWTGSEDDWIEPTNSSWRNFADYVESPERVFIDIRGEGHMRVMGSKPYSPHPFVQWIKLYAFGNETAAKYFYGNPPGIWSGSKDPKKKNNPLPSDKHPETVPVMMKAKGQNSASWGQYHAGYVACSKKYGEFTLPANMTALCHAPQRYPWKDGTGWDIPARCRVHVDSKGRYKGTDDGDVPNHC